MEGNLVMLAVNSVARSGGHAKLSLDQAVLELRVPLATEKRWGWGRPTPTHNADFI